MNILGLHGFLGQGRDFEPLWQSLRPQLSFETWTPKLFTPGLKSLPSFQDWPETLFTQWDQRWPKQPAVAVGYSLGGRLLLHAVLAAPERFQAVILLSVNPGLITQEPEARRAWEAQWAQRFRSDGWTALLKDWNALPVFMGSFSAPRLESEYSREALAQAFELWSVTRHGFELSALEGLQNPLLWCFGGLDKKYCELGRRLQEHLPGRFETMPGAGHRLLADAPERVAKALIECVSGLK